MHRHSVSKKEKKTLSAHFERLLGISYDQLKKLVVEVMSFDKYTVYFVDGMPALVINESGKVFPHLKYLVSTKLREKETLPLIVVDEGAVKPITRGADLMAPGIVSIKGLFGESDVAVVVNPTNIPIAVVEMIMDYHLVKEAKRGKVAKNLHHLGDRLWSLG